PCAFRAAYAPFGSSMARVGQKRAESPPGVVERTGRARPDAASRRDCRPRRGGDHEAAPHLLPLARVGTMPPRRGVPGAGAAAPAQPRHVPAAPRGAGGPSRPARALPGRERADDLRARGEAPDGPPRRAARVPRDRGVPRALAPVARRRVRAASSSSPRPSRVPFDAGTKRALPADAGRARRGAAARGRLAVRAEMGRVPRSAGERRRRARALVAERAAAAALLPRARAAWRADAATFGDRRRDRDRTQGAA